MRAKLKEIKAGLKARMHLPIPRQGQGFEIALDVANKREVVRICIAPDRETLPARTGVSRIEGYEQIQEDDHERGQQNRHAQVPGIEFAELQDRPHHDRNEQNRDVHFDVAQANRVAIAGDQIAQLGVAVLRRQPPLDPPETRLRVL